MNADLLEPLKFYETTAKKRHEDAAEELFESLLQKSGINADENRATVKAYDAQVAVVNSLNSRVGKLKTYRTLLIIGAIVGGLLFFVGIGADLSKTAKTLLSVFGILAAGASLVTIFTVIKSALRESAGRLGKEREKAEEQKRRAWDQVAALNALFTDDMTVKLIEKTLPDFHFAPFFSAEEEDNFETNFDFSDHVGSEASVTDTLSGRFGNSPFLFLRTLNHHLGSETYVGHLTIHWTETRRDSQGRTVTQHRSQVLSATVTKPKPFYTHRTFLTFGHGAAPDLSFTRNPAHVERLNKKQIDRKVDSGEKKIQNLARKAAQGKGRTNFTDMANSEFDVLFGALDRDHEVQFRMMYTPLAQENTVNLLRDSKIGYGDDFVFRKNRKTNYIISDHAQNWNLSTSPKNYFSYDVDEIKSKFVGYNATYFKNLYFDFAPLFCVPMYLEDAPSTPIAEKPDRPNFSLYEAEAAANGIGEIAFSHPNSKTPCILKATYVGRTGSTDEATITAFSYDTAKHVDFIPTLGGDGHIHNVPVEWIEYLPLTYGSRIALTRREKDGEENELAYANEHTAAGFHDLFATLLNPGETATAFEKYIHNYYKK